VIGFLAVAVVVIGIGLVEPARQSIVGCIPRAERLAHWADERRPGVPDDVDRPRIRRRRRCHEAGQARRDQDRAKRARHSCGGW